MAYRVLEGKSSLQGARDTYVGEESEIVNWTEVDSSSDEYAQLEALAEEEENSMESFAAGIDGIKYDMTFKAGEYKKVITINAMSDKVSESEEQILFALFAAENAEIGDLPTAYANIQDTNEVVESVFEVTETDIYVERGQEYAEVVIRRTQGVDRHAAVIVGTSEGTAKVSTDYVSMKEEVFFMQGVTEQTVKIPVMVCYDGFITSHSVENITLMENEEIKNFLGEYEPDEYLLDQNIKI